MMKKQKRTNQKRSIIYKICSLLLLFVSLFLVGNLLYLNVLSNLYIVIIIGIVLLLNGTLSYMMLKGKKKGTGIFLSLILILVLGLLDFYLGKTTGLLSGMNLNYKTYNYSVLVLENSDYQKLKDLNGENIGYFDDGSNESKQSLNKVLNKIELEPSPYEDTQKLATALLEQEVEAILIENSYLEILNESLEVGENTFKESVRKIYGFTIITQTSDISKDIDVVKTPFNIYISGIDTYGEISSVSRSDVNMVVTINPQTRQILLTSIPRDYYVSLHGKSGYKDKLTHAGLYGIDMSIQTIEDLLDIEINYYVKANFSSVVDIVNAIEGVKVYSDYTFTSIDNYRYQKGYNEVNGEEALSFARERKAFALGDRQRIKNQQALLQAIFDKCTSKAIITKYSKLLDSVQNSFVTNMKMSRLTSLIKLQLSKNYDWNIVTNSLNGSDASNYTYSAPSTKAYVMEPIEEDVDFAHDLIKKVINGEKLESTTIDVDKAQANKVTKNDNSTNTTTNHSNSTTNNKEEENIKNNNSSIQNKLSLRLGRRDVKYVKGIDKAFVYYGYAATYNGKDITDTKNIQEEFKIGTKSYDNYQDLVYYVSGLDVGTYTIRYKITYQGFTAEETQTVTISELDDIEDVPGKDEDENQITIPNSQPSEDDQD